MQEIKKIIRKASAGRWMVPYLLLFVAFPLVFNYIEKYYIKSECRCDDKKNYPIDMNLVNTGHFFDATYVSSAAHNCYDKAGYFRTFFPLDMIFPLVYSLLMFSMINLAQWPRSRQWLPATIRLGALFDYGEDFSFAWYLHHTDVDGYAVATGIFTTLKTCLLFFNMLTCLYVLWRWTWKDPQVVSL